MRKQKQQNIWMSVNEVADWMDVTPQTIRNWVHDGLFDVRGVRQLRRHGRIRISRDAVTKAINKGWLVP